MRHGMPALSVRWLKLSLSMRPVHTAVNALLISPASSSNFESTLP
jgi:hypothetical protein